MFPDAVVKFPTPHNKLPEEVKAKLFRIMGWRMADAPVTSMRIQKDPDWNVTRTIPLGLAPKAKASRGPVNRSGRMVG